MEKSKESPCYLQDSNIRIIRVPEERRGGWGQQKVYLKKYLILSQKVLAIQVYKTNGSYYYLNAKRPSLRHII